MEWTHEKQDCGLSGWFRFLEHMLDSLLLILAAFLRVTGRHCPPRSCCCSALSHDAIGMQSPRDLKTPDPEIRCRQNFDLPVMSSEELGRVTSLVAFM